MNGIVRSRSFFSLPLYPPFFLMWSHGSSSPVRWSEMIPSWWTILSISYTEVSSLVPLVSAERRGLLACFNCNHLLPGCFQLLVNGWAYMGDNLYSVFFTSNKSWKIEKKKIKKKKNQKKNNAILGKLSMAKTLHWPLLTKYSNLLWSKAARLRLVPLSPAACLLLALPPLLSTLSPAGREWEIGCCNCSRCLSISWRGCFKVRGDLLIHVFCLKHKRVTCGEGWG